MTIDPYDSLVHSNKTPYMISCRKRGKILLHEIGVFSGFMEDNVHFAHGNMYYYLSAKNDEQALRMAERMRKKLINKDWNENTNLGIQKQSKTNSTK